MGVVQRQTIKSAIYAYSGTLIGFVTVGILFPIYLSTSEIGVLNLVNRWSMIIMQIGTLGFPAAMVKFFPYFRNKERKHHGFLFLTLFIGLIGYILISGILFIFNADIIENEKDKSPLFSQYFNYIYLITFFYLFFYLLDIYSRVIYQSSAAVLLREFVQRVMVICLMCCVVAGLFGFNVFIILYFTILCLPTIFLFMFLWIKNEIHLTPNFEIFRTDYRKPILQRSLFGLISGLGLNGLLSIDAIMLNEFEGEANTGIYTTIFYFASLILIPARAYGRLAANIVAECIKDNDMNRLKKVYHSSCLNQFIIGIVLFTILMVNADNIFTFLKPEYRAGYYIILIIGLGNLFEMATGVNHSIIDNSKHYRFGTYFVGILIICTIGFNLLLVPSMGINGIALGTALAMVIYNLVKTIFIYIHYKLWPFSLKFIAIILFSTLLIIGFYFIPNFQNVYINTGFKTSISLLLLLAFVYFGNISEEINIQFNKLARRVFFIHQKK